MLHHLQEIDSFLDDPNYVREVALRQKYAPCNFLELKSLYPGYRTSNIDLKIKEEIRSKLEKIYNTKFKVLQCFFTYVTHESMLGIPHVDPFSDISGLIYLSPNFTSDSGTTIFNETDEESSKRFIPEYRSKIEILYNTTIKPSNSIKRNIAKEMVELKKTFQVLKTFDNCFNKGVFYPAKYLHSANNYFGERIDDSRLTLNMFGSF